MSEELALMKREEIVETFKPWDGLTHKDVKLGSASGVKFKLTTHGETEDVPAAVIAGEDYPMTSKALAEVSRVVGIQQGYAQRCPTELLFPHLEHWYGSGGTGKARFYLKNNVIIGCNGSAPDYHTDTEILESIEKAIGTEQILGYQTPSSGLEHSMFSVVVNRSFEAVPGDMLFGGIEVQNSIVGERTIEIAPFIFRQVCSNGMISSENIARWSRKEEDENFNLWTQQNAKSALERIEGEFHRIKKLTEVPVGEHVDNTLRSLFQKFGIPTRTQNEIVGEAAVMNQGNGPETMYDIWNAITRVGTHSPKLSVASARDIRCVAGQVVKEVSLCPSCNQLCGE